MKILKYNICNFASSGAETELEINESFYEVTIPYSEENEEIAKREAYNGEYVIEDDGKPDPAKTPSQLDVIEAQVTYTAMMTDTLLEV